MNQKKYLIETAKYILRSYPVIRTYINKVERLYGMTPQELRDYKEQRFLYIFRRAFDKSPFYHRLYCEAGIKKEDIKRLEDIVKLPVVTKDMVKKYGLEMLTVPKWQVIAGHTSGTTGTPLTVYENWPSIWWEQAYNVCYQKKCGLIDGQSVLSLRGNLDKRMMSMKVHIGNTLYLSSYNINAQTAEYYYQQILAHKPVAAKGYPSSLYALALVFKDKRLECHIPVMFTSSETLYPHQRRLIEEVFHTQIYDHYGTTERTVSIEEAHDHDGYYEAPGYGVTEYHDDYLITTSLINDAFPLIRYKTEDRILLKDGVKKTKEGFIDYDSIEKIDGRAIAYVVCKDGTPISDSALTFIFKHNCGVRYAQFVQQEAGMVDLNLVTDESYSTETEQYLLDWLDKTFGKGNMDTRIHKIEESGLKYSSRNKLPLVISNCNTNTYQGGVIKAILGRTDDYIVCKDGSMVTRVDFVEDGNHIKACQWIQHHEGELEVRIVPDEGFTEHDKQFVINATLERCGRDNIDLNPIICTMNDLEYTSRGKFRLIVNKKANNNSQDITH